MDQRRQFAVLRKPFGRFSEVGEQCKKLFAGVEPCMLYGLLRLGPVQKHCDGTFMGAHAFCFRDGKEQLDCLSAVVGFTEHVQSVRNEFVLELMDSLDKRSVRPDDDRRDSTPADPGEAVLGGGSRPRRCCRHRRRRAGRAAAV